MRIVFMGTPEFAVPSLNILVENGYEVVAVVTATDKYGGRGGKQLIESAVKKYALEKNLPIIQPEKLKSPEFVNQLEALKPDLQVVVAFRMLPEIVWSLPRIGTFNLHGSLLPKYRGAAPINWAIIKGEKETGVTTFFITHEIDTGDILMQEKISIGENETAGELHDRMMFLGAETGLKTVKMIESGQYILQKQNEAEVSKAPKIFHETCKINFEQSAGQVHNFIRGLSPYPAAWTMLGEEQLKIYRSRKIAAAHTLPPGTIQTDSKDYLKIATLDGFVEILELQLQGRKRMDVKSFLNGFGVKLQNITPNKPA